MFIIVDKCIYIVNKGDTDASAMNSDNENVL